ncbi:MAG: metal-binding protein, partial [Cyanobacteria bacterium SW_4_48_29]
LWDYPQFYGTTYKNYVKAIKKIQSVLGHLQDTMVLAEFLAEAFESNLNSEMPTLATQVTNTRYQKWKEWQSLQRQFLDSQLRQDLRMTVQQPMPELVAH